MMNFAEARTNMIEGQLRPNRVVNERLLEALAAVPREEFVPEEAVAIAYVDEAIEVEAGRFLMEPMVQARLLQEADIKPTEAVLEVACGTGYGAALMGRLASSVVALEENPVLVFSATRKLQKVGARNVVVVRGPLTLGYAANAPYDVIFLGGGVSAVPVALFDQLAEGGRLLAIVGTAGLGQAMLWQKANGVVASRVLFDAGIPMLPEFTFKPGFVF
jgi:protein-L-isoaspartate(D-aspartate) O-methyltransferase